MKRRILAFVLCLLMVTGMTVTSGYAEEETSAVEKISLGDIALDADPTPTPESTPEVTPEPTPEVTPEPTPEPTPEVTPEPTAEPTPTPTATPDGLILAINKTALALDSNGGEEEKTYVAQIGDTKYETLADAIDAATSGATITLLTDVVENITVEKDLTLDLNGCTLSRPSGDGYYPAIKVIGHTLVVKDSGADGKITTDNEGWEAIGVEAGGKVKFTDGTIETPVYGIYVWGASTAVVSGGTIDCTKPLTGNSPDSDNTMVVTGGTFTTDIRTAEGVVVPYGYNWIESKDVNSNTVYTVSKDETVTPAVVATEADGSVTYYTNLDDLFAAGLTGEVTVELMQNVSTTDSKNVDTSYYTTYNFITNVEDGVTMDWTYQGDKWNYVQFMSIGQGITLNVPELLVWSKLDIYGTVNAGYAYFMGADVTVREGAELNVTTCSDKTIQVKDDATLTVNGTVTAGTINVWVDSAKLVVSGEKASVTADWIDIWDGTPSVVIENNATLEVDAIKASRGGAITVDGATLKTADLELGHNGNSSGALTVTNDGAVTCDSIKLTAPGSTFTGPAGMNVTTTVEGYKVTYVDGVYTLVAKENIAKVGDTYYSDLKEAVTAASAAGGSIIKLLQDVVLTEKLVISGSVTFDGGEYMLTYDENGLFTLSEGATLRIMGGKFSEDVSQYCADGYACVLVSEGVYKIQPTSRVTFTSGKSGQTYLYTITNSKNESMTIAVPPAGVSLELLFGDYTISLNSKWHWRNAAGNLQTVTIDEAYESVTLTVPGTTKTGWFSDYSN